MKTKKIDNFTTPPLHLELALLVSVFKLFFIPLYRSTDFEVHRNWLAITSNLTTDKWYYESTSEWTLDYPPLFAWMEYLLSHVAKYFDPEMLVIANLNYRSTMTVVFQRLSVIVTDIVYFIGAKSCTDLVGNGKFLAYFLLVTNPGLLMIDHIHFQYNGFMYGILLLSISSMIKTNYIQSAFWFALLLNFKHIYLYIAPVYAVYLLRAHCFTVPSKDGTKTAWYSFSLVNLVKIGAVVVGVFAVSFGPFYQHLPQVFSRLFPFKRGLCHAYWAPNFWALYNVVDKILQFALMKHGYIRRIRKATMTGGLVQEYHHEVLPSVAPIATFILTVVTMIPALVKMWSLCADKRYRVVNFVRCIVICATCAFMFGWHVHEKAILMILIPLTFLAVLGLDDGRQFMLMSTLGHYSLFPLLFPKYLLPVKIFMLLTHCAVAYYFIPYLYVKKRRSQTFMRIISFSYLESFYVYGFFVLCIYENFVHSSLKLDKKYPFLPLMLTSTYCAFGVLYFWLTYYYYFLTFNLSRVKVVTVKEDDGRIDN